MSHNTPLDARPRISSVGTMALKVIVLTFMLILTFSIAHAERIECDPEPKHNCNVIIDSDEPASLVKDQIWNVACIGTDGPGKIWRNCEGQRMNFCEKGTYLGSGKVQIVLDPYYNGATLTCMGTWLKRGKACAVTIEYPVVDAVPLAQDHKDDSNDNSAKKNFLVLLIEWLVGLFKGTGSLVEVPGSCQMLTG